jgi:osmoprotectant transport system permease protein
MIPVLAARPPAWSGFGFDGNWDVVWHYTLVHLRITALALTLGAAVAFPLGLAGYRWRRSYPGILGVTNVLYTIPSLSLLVLLGLGFGLGLLNDRPLIVALAIYTLAILVRNLVEGLRAVPESVKDAAAGVGYTPRRSLLAIELPLAVPAIMAGLRVAAVSTISLVSVGGVLGRGGLGFLFFEGFRRNRTSEIIAGIGASVLLAMVVDVALVLTRRVLAPWNPARAARR